MKAPQKITGEELKRTIKRLGMTQGDFAELFGLGYRTVNGWVREEQAVPLAVIVALRLMERYDLAPADISEING